MAITTLDGAIAGFQSPRPLIKAVTPTLVVGKYQSTWALGGLPGAGSYDTTLNGVVLSSSSAMVAGQVPHVDPGSGNAYLARLQASATQACTILLLDRLWHNGGFTITTTTAQSITSPTWPARDAAGSTNGDGVLVAVEVSAAVGAASPAMTLQYTNQAGTAGRSASLVTGTTALSAAAAGSMFLFGLQAGDTGIRSVQSLTLGTSWVSGTINLVALRILAALELPIAATPNSLDALTGGMPRLYNGAVPFMAILPSTTTATIVSGAYVETQG